MSKGAIGIIGLGNIGRGVAASYLDKSSFDVFVWDVQEPARAHFLGQLLASRRHGATQGNDPAKRRREHDDRPE